MTHAAKSETPRFFFGRSHKLKGRILVDTVYKTGKKRVAHPLIGYSVRRSDNGDSRLGISIGKRCGNAVARNAIKRRLREAFRLAQHHLPPGSDYLLVVKPHRLLDVTEYQARQRQVLQ